MEQYANKLHQTIEQLNIENNEFREKLGLS